mmetsp:Transcript_32165/g.76378  ORF Transcript_32165/g.76378 Transcript_32165/m.76378 type:complete len:255 (+) Transcript_32165:61-825(+)|eukprot:CAMPEP_0180139332 /NCGR_PEP_ID=MMETSP0986-20121125/13470_1 /TAXON_ID=697907 /ORGANISM="non described non described, Strain CCMP2293" /LENGTH=254 /DNA_ID=CAMNT_0022081415 /DNA_START=53 /DNA_END=817 /DNA_ORIENTATION=-
MVSGGVSHAALLALALVLLPAGEAFAPLGLAAGRVSLRRHGALGLAAQEGGEKKAAPRGGAPVSQWGKRFASALDANPGRSERRERSEQEDRYKQVLATSPKNVDALCGYACFKSTVREDYDVAAELYTTALRSDPERARRITIQLWADLWSMRQENARAEEAKGKWLAFFATISPNGGRRIPVADVAAAFEKMKFEVPTALIAEATVPQGEEYVVNYEVLCEKLATSAMLPRNGPPSRVKSFFSALFAPAAKL